MYNCIALIIFARETGKIERAVDIGFVHEGFVTAEVIRLNLDFDFPLIGAS